MVAIELNLQFQTPHPELTEPLLYQWVSTTVHEVAAIYQEANQAVPFQKIALTLRFCDETEGRTLNQQFRHKDYATNVLTFEYGIDATGTLSSDIIICIPVLIQEAKEQKKPFLHHAAHLCVHGVLHALGYDHLDDEEAEEMESLEIDILHTMDIPNPYH